MKNLPTFFGTRKDLRSGEREREGDRECTKDIESAKRKSNEEITFSCFCTISDATKNEVQLNGQSYLLFQVVCLKPKYSFGKY